MKSIVLCLAILSVSLVVVASVMAEGETVTLCPIVDPMLAKNLPARHGTVLDQHRIELRWSESDDAGFEAYRVYCSLDPEFAGSPEPATVITDRGTTSTIISGGQPVMFATISGV